VEQGEGVVRSEFSVVYQSLQQKKQFLCMSGMSLFSRGILIRNVVEQVEQGEGGRHIIVEQVEQRQGGCPIEPLLLFQSGSSRPWNVSPEEGSVAHLCCLAMLVNLYIRGLLN